MNITYCDFCFKDCKNKEENCIEPLKQLFEENKKLTKTIKLIRNEITRKKSYMSKIISIKEIIDE